MANSLIKRILSHVPFATEPSTKFTYESDNTFSISQQKPVTNVKHFDICICLSAHICIVDVGVRISLRKSFDGESENSLGEVYIHQSSTKELRAVLRFFESSTFRDRVLAEIRDAESSAILQRIVHEILPGPLQSTEISVENDVIYVVDTRTCVESSDTVVYTSNIYWDNGYIVVKTWRAFETVYVSYDNEHDYLPWLWTDIYIEASHANFEFILANIK